MKPATILPEIVAALASESELCLRGRDFRSAFVEAWSAKQLVKIISFPTFCLMVFTVIIVWHSDGDISRSRYWNIQLDWFLDMNGYLSSFPVLFANLTQLGDGLILLPMLSFLIIWRPQAWAAVFGAIPLGTLLSAGGKYLAAVPRPAVVLDPEVFTVIGGAHKGYHSLPSGHTITIFGMTAIILFVLIPLPRTKAQYCVLTVGLLVATLLSISRVAVGVHWPLDILAGAALGYLAGVSGVVLTQRYRRWWDWLTVEKYQFIFGAIMLAWSLSLLNKVFKHSDSMSIVIWIAAIMGLITSFYLFKNSAKYFFKMPSIL